VLGQVCFARLGDLLHPGLPHAKMILTSAPSSFASRADVDPRRRSLPWPPRSSPPPTSCFAATSLIAIWERTTSSVTIRRESRVASSGVNHGLSLRESFLDERFHRVAARRDDEALAGAAILDD
jgi:hypothetical protein